MPMHDPTHVGEANTGSFKFIHPVESLKHAE
jgi:hypothetical protein